MRVVVLLEQVEEICLNPCCNGIYSMRLFVGLLHKKMVLSLNPCCNGIYSMSQMLDKLAMGMMVLILVVMEYTQ